MIHTTLETRIPQHEWRRFYEDPTTDDDKRSMLQTN
jgi:hypothetical protein